MFKPKEDYWYQVAMSMNRSKGASGSTSSTNGESSPANPDPDDNKLTTGPKKLSPGEIRKLKKGGVDIHKLKGGRGSRSRFDLYKDRNGDVYVARKGGTGEFEHTGVNVKDF